MGVAPAKIIFMVILSFEVVLVSSPNIIIVTKKSRQTSVRLTELPLQYLQACFTTLFSIAMIPIDCKITNFSLHLCNCIAKHALAVLIG